MARIEVTRTITEYINLDIPDYEFTQAEIDAKIEAAIDDGGDGDTEWEWLDGEPKPKDGACPLSNEFWFDSKFGKLATNGFLLITEKFPLPTGFKVDNYPWKRVNRSTVEFCEGLTVEFCEGLLDKSAETMTPHTGWFGEIFKPFVEIPGLSVSSETVDPESAGYLVLAGEIVGVIMPVSRLGDTTYGCFQWNQE